MRTKRRPPSRPGQPQQKRRQGGQGGHQGRRQQGGSHRHNGPMGGGGGGGGGGGSGPKRPYGRPGRGGQFNKQQHGPKTCPMCGAVVGDLARHIQDRHDDPQSHPRE